MAFRHQGLLPQYDVYWAHPERDYRECGSCIRTIQRTDIPRWRTDGHDGEEFVLTHDGRMAVCFWCPPGPYLRTGLGHLYRPDPHLPGSNPLIFRKIPRKSLRNSKKQKYLVCPPAMRCIGSRWLGKVMDSDVVRRANQEAR